jgi:hypothetical protein
MSFMHDFLEPETVRMKKWAQLLGRIVSRKVMVKMAIR